MKSTVNRALCAKCGGACCKKMPGATSPEDWGAPNRTVFKHRLQSGLSSGRWIIATLHEDPTILYVMPLLTGKGCIFLGPEGCAMSYYDRPEGCRLLIPSENFPDCQYPKSIVGVRHFAEKWRQYQRELVEVEQSIARPVPSRRHKTFFQRWISWLNA